MNVRFTYFLYLWCLVAVTTIGIMVSFHSYLFYSNYFFELPFVILSAFGFLGILILGENRKRFEVK